MNTTTDFLGYTVIADGIDAGRYATPEVAMQVYADDLYSYISDASKDAQGFRLRMDISGMTFAELESQCDYWSEQVTRAIDEEKIEAELRVLEFKKWIQTCINNGADNEVSALCWICDTEEFYNPQDVEAFVWKQGILFTDYGKDILKKLYELVTYKELV